MKYANLHLHSTFSDGVYTPRELCSIAKEMGYGAIALTDHETVAGYPLLKEAAEEYGLMTILGAEFYAEGFGQHFHIVGMDFDPTEFGMANYLRRLTEGAYLYTYAKFEELEKKGLTEGLTWQEICDDAEENAWLCNEQIFASLVKRRGYTQDLYWTYSKAFRAQKVAVERPEVPRDAADVISLIRNAGGVAILAHPHGQTEYLPALCKIGLRGVEYDHPDLSLEDRAAVEAFTREETVYLSGGTDHTGGLGDYPFLRGDMPGARERAEKDGAYYCPLDTDVLCGVTQEEFEALRDRVYG